MQKINRNEVEGTEFPAGRRTKVLVGPCAALEGQHFVQGIVTIYPGGSVPEHSHNEEETYTILTGEGEMTVDDETEAVREGDTVYIPPNKSHGLKNTGKQNLLMMFVYSPKVVAEHWKQETEGHLK